MVEKSSKQKEKCQVCGKRDLITDNDSGEVYCRECLPKHRSGGRRF